VRRGPHQLLGDLVEIVEDEKKLAQIVECFIAAAEGRSVAMLSDEAVADAVNGADAKLGEVLAILDLSSHRHDAVSAFCCRYRFAASRMIRSATGATLLIPSTCCNSSTGASKIPRKV
jgi:hypothetical protein